MKYHFARIPVIDDGSVAEEFNRFCAGRKIVQVDKHFVADGERSFWAICVGYLDGDNKNTVNNRIRIDYREVLNDEDFSVYAKLRTERKSIAEAEGIPAYSVFTNEQLAALVTGKIATKDDMRKIDGIGSTRIDKYADAMLAILVAKGAKSNAPSKDRS